MDMVTLEEFLEKEKDDEEIFYNVKLKKRDF